MDIVIDFTHHVSVQGATEVQPRDRKLSEILPFLGLYDLRRTV